MLSNKDLYAWAAPATFQGSPVDHTWVTTYDNRVLSFPGISAVIAGGEDYWFCWGTYHGHGGTPGLPDGALGQQAGDLGLARCLVASNVSSSASFAARGTIFTYGVDGVCHQLANQVLYATSLGGSTPLTVARARGYRFSSAIYGTYGLQHAAWRSRIAACTATASPHSLQWRSRGEIMAHTSPVTQPDEFEEHVGRVLGAGGLVAASRLLHMRAQFQTAAAAQAHAIVAPSADELNARNQRFLDDASKILSYDEFVAVFEIPPGTKMSLVIPDPSI